MPRFGLTLSTLVLLAGCGEEANIAGKELPQMEISTDRIDFGDASWGESVLKTITIRNTGALPLGVSNIALGIDEMEANFNLHLGTFVDCDGSSESNDDADEGEIIGGEEDTGMATDDVQEGEAAITFGSVIVINQGCTYDFQVSLNPTSVGAIFGSVIVETKTAKGEEPAHYQDPDDAYKTVILQGSSSKGAGNIIVSPRTLDFAHPSAGEQVTKYIEFHNVGNGPLTIETPELDDGCDDRFSFDFARLETGDLTLEARTSTLIPVTYTPTTGGNAQCEMTVTSTDIDTPSSRVSLRGEMGTDPLCTPPSLDLISPDPGQIHGTSDDLILELRIADADQPPTTLHCEVTSTFNDDEDAPSELADCRPYSDSGYTLVPVPTSLLMDGTDTLVVTVQDDCGYETTASVAVVWHADYPETDDDQDGFADGPIDNPDCDDTDIWVYPGATEIFDGKDNDCDGEIDENTDGMDDDGDGFSETEGDCNDFDDTVYPGAPEQPDVKDNDCDGTVDDNTGLYDDDGDGFAETDNDCSDGDPNVHPAAIEYCDGIDNNCNGLKDERDGCIEIDAAPMILGEIQMGATAIGQGESTIMTISVYDPDGSEFDFTWQEDDVLAQQGHSGFDSIATQTVTWTAPRISDTSEGEVYTLYVVVNDPEGHSDWAFGEITVYPDPVDGMIGGYNASEDDDEGGCGKDDDEAASAAIFAPLLLLLGWRRRDDA